ncbi:MAG: HEPN domain-containing protein [Geminicoccaceae bacterium]
MTEAITRPRPQIDDPEELNRVVSRLVATFDPVAVYLFGSRARGEANADSDYDLMIVLPDDNTRVRSRQVVWDTARSRRIDVNPLLTRAEAFAWRRHEVGTLEYEVEVDGIRLYPASGMDLPAGGARTRGRGSMNVNVVEEWLRRIERDLTAARKCNEGHDAVPDQAAYHIQQAAEELTKAALVAHQLRPRKDHQIQEFTPLLPDDFPLKERFRQLGRFSDYAWAHRYPEYPGQEPIPEPSVTDAGAWLDEVRDLKADFERWLGQAASGAKRG